VGVVGEIILDEVGQDIDTAGFDLPHRDVRVKVGSTMATLACSAGKPPSDILTWDSQWVRTALGFISEPVPAMVGTWMMGRIGFCGMARCKV